MDAHYRILYSGNLMPGQTPDDVAQRMAAKFRMREESARELILKGSGRVLKQRLNAVEVERYRAALMAIGLAITIEPEDLTEPQDDSVLRPYVPPSAAQQGETHAKPEGPSLEKPSRTDGSWSQCPKCGAEQVSDLTGVCQTCGVVAERYRVSLDEAPPTPGAREDVLYAPRSVSAGRGWSWIGDAWDLFKQAPGGWIGASVLFYLIVIALSLVPLIGGLATTIIGPMMIAGLIIGAHALHNGEEFSVGLLFAGLSRKPRPLALVGVVYLLLTIVTMIIVMAIFTLMIAGSEMMASATLMGPSNMDAMFASPAFLLPMLVAMLMGIALTMAMFFAPALVALNDVPVLQAFKLSFMGCLKNILPFLLYGLTAMVMFMLGALPFMLGLLLVVPVLMITFYTAYRDIFYR